ncbi:hypothetical protein ACO2Q0_02760 [Phenylobacterium sp. VNQ135]|uniref:hypothetical protein n=1 Tax=Phenylobacterium sp. VNQ135 TaxID=3400922 RepID=UPI003C0F6A8A
MSGASYPSSAGHRGVSTSIEAAEALKPCVKTIQAQVLAALRVRPMTSWEVAQYLKLPFETCQPRTSELQALHLIEDSGLRGPARSPNRTAIRWRVTERAA